MKKPRLGENRGLGFLEDVADSEFCRNAVEKTGMSSLPNSSPFNSRSQGSWHEAGPRLLIAEQGDLMIAHRTPFQKLRPASAGAQGMDLAWGCFWHRVQQRQASKPGAYCIIGRSTSSDRRQTLQCSSTRFENADVPQKTTDTSPVNVTIWPPSTTNCASLVPIDRRTSRG
jgi:hypothetical protein